MTVSPDCYRCTVKRRQCITKSVTFSLSEVCGGWIRKNEVMLYVHCPHSDSVCFTHPTVKGLRFRITSVI